MRSPLHLNSIEIMSDGSQIGDQTRENFDSAQSTDHNRMFNTQTTFKLTNKDMRSPLHLNSIELTERNGDTSPVKRTASRLAGYMNKATMSEAVLLIQTVYR